MRAAYVALLLGLLLGLGMATAVLSNVRPPPATVAAALGVEDGPGIDNRRAAAVAALITACMRRESFDWTSVPEAIPEPPDASLDPIAWADRWGFGVSTMADHPSPSPRADANLAALERMSPAAQSALRAALHGSASDPGCTAQANEEVYGLRERAMAPLRPAFDRLQATIDADPVAQAADATWRGCVAAVSRGLPLERQTLAPALLQRAVDRLVDVRADRATLADVQLDERRTAGVLARCERGYADARGRVATRYEAPFVADHLDQLEAIGRAIRTTEATWPSQAP